MSAASPVCPRAMSVILWRTASEARRCRCVACRPIAMSRNPEAPGTAWRQLPEPLLRRCGRMASRPLDARCVEVDADRPVGVERDLQNPTREILPFGSWRRRSRPSSPASAAFPTASISARRRATPTSSAATTSLSRSRRCTFVDLQCPVAARLEMGEIREVACIFADHICAFRRSRSPNPVPSRSPSPVKPITCRSEATRGFDDAAQ